MCSQGPPHFGQILTADITPPAKRIRKTGNAVMSHRFTYISECYIENNRFRGYDDQLIGQCSATTPFRRTDLGTYIEF
jgi:hypothetical protein